MNRMLPHFLKISTFRQLKKSIWRVIYFKNLKAQFSTPVSPHSWLDLGDQGWERSFTLLPNSLMICLARLILDLSEAFDSVNHKVLVTRLWSMGGVGWAPFEVSWAYIPGRRVSKSSHEGLFMIHITSPRRSLVSSLFTQHGQETLGTVSGGNNILMILISLSSFVLIQSNCLNLWLSS